MIEKVDETEPQNTRSFNPNEHLIQLRSRNGSSDYLPVAWRIAWFRSLCPNGTIETEIVHLDLDRETEEEGTAWNNETRRSEKIVKRAPGIAVFRATVRDGRGGVATGTKSEKAASFPDFIEKSETGAIGRALAALGYGTQFAGDEFFEEHRIADSPVESRNGDRPATDDQIREIGVLAAKVRQQVTRPTTYDAAVKLITELHQAAQAAVTR